VFIHIFISSETIEEITFATGKPSGSYTWAFQRDYTVEVHCNN